MKISSVFIWLKGYNGSFGKFSVGSPGIVREITFSLVFSSISSKLSWRVSDNVKLVSKSLFWKSNCESTFISSSTTRPGVGFMISSNSASFSASATSAAAPKSV